LPTAWAVTERNSISSIREEGYHELHHSEISLESNSQGQSRREIMDILKSKASCKAGGCAKPAVISLAARELCLDHFLFSCYERLDMLEPMVRSRPLDRAEVQAIRGLLEECSNRTLLVCLRHEPLTNLDRSRLLEILLLCGDLQLMISKSLFPAGSSPSPYSFDVLSRSVRPREKQGSQQKKRPRTNES
jgi:hypothetical protein